jgi:hypothetical protein
MPVELTKVEYEKVEQNAKTEIEKCLRDLMEACEYTQADTEKAFVQGLVANINKTGRRGLPDDKILAALAAELAGVPMVLQARRIPGGKMTHLRDHCKDTKNPVTPSNGVTVDTPAGGQKTTLAYVHDSCKEAWAQKRSGTTFAGLKK